VTGARAASAPAAAGPLVLALRGARIGYGAQTVLRDVDWEVRAGETWFLIGPNGAGKTTLLRAVLGLLPLQSGTLERDPARAERAHIGFVPQRCEMNPALPTTVCEFVTLGLVGLRTAPGERAERLAEALARAGLAGLEERSYWALSGGQRQRALVARALVRRPALLILDEPTEGLDPPTEAAFLDLVEALRLEHGVTVLFVTHRLAVAARRASHVALVFAGALVSGPRDAVLARPEMRSAFGGGWAGVP
jgi:ABC-type Mn2+/Zn2+ transport system ATPase subunit